MVLIGIIGGTGLENPNFFQQRTEIEVETTPWGDSGTIFSGFINGIKCYDAVF